uniref:ribosomal protein L23 n=1 Tax=Glaucosphaera vacuolata TaxID=38265 RepID=UPI001FCDF3FF|nr:ribosomal protein L23 [Glaucosphaera vacuolata]UNJ18736.1 ribosomal protein L23 [Glaucosphaera vacuolata]
MMNIDRKIFDIIKYPIITDKATRLLETNQYSFWVNTYANKTDIKQAVEQIFNVKVIAINTLNSVRKRKTVGKFIGYRSKYKKAIVTLAESNTINIFPET